MDREYLQTVTIQYLTDIYNAVLSLVVCCTASHYTLLKFRSNHKTLWVSVVIFKFNTLGAVVRVLW